MMQLARSHPIMGAFGACARRTHPVVPMALQVFGTNTIKPFRRHVHFCNFSSFAVQRDPTYNRWDGNDLRAFEAIFNGNRNQMLQDAEETDPYTIDWLKKYKAKSSRALVLRPSSTEQVSAILQHCNSRKLAIVPQGGNTGLVGGSIPVFDEIVLSMSLMNRIKSLDNVSGILLCESGCILEHLDQHVSEHGYRMPLDLGAKGSCQIGGNIATNAGGLRYLRYGSLHGNVLGIEAVLADGTIIDTLSSMRKDNTGYDLKQLFIGSEGTLGVITQVAISTPTRFSSHNVAYLACENFDAIQATYLSAKQHLGEILSAVEFLDRESLDMVLSQQQETRDPLEASPSPFYILIETAGSTDEHDREKLETFLTAVMEDGHVNDGIVAQDSIQATKLFQIREDITLALSMRGSVYKYDVSLPIAEYYNLVYAIRNRLGSKYEDVQVVGYGHLGDGNLHLNVSTKQYNDNILADLEPFVFEWIAMHRGSISAEHGIGVHKPEYLHLSKSKNAISLMRLLKQTMDPNGILNPYKIIPKIRPDE
uniref:D2hydroxyglutarate dehydrogenase putative n=1 Tax=Albugo laibachii Nc14 TaxID=890382 RepID=F0W8L0_9STRA|nr:D2hydroxyglutarate dehydrogenase putative [Albugo laibachii Nc14]|eukprot:CCA17465.1 D2hydroxyglutarate dehydrogenase putative [Albugo laibachii Nc14]